MVHTDHAQYDGLRNEKRLHECYLASWHHYKCWRRLSDQDCMIKHSWSDRRALDGALLLHLGTSTGGMRDAFQIAPGHCASAHQARAQWLGPRSGGRTADRQSVPRVVSAKKCYYFADIRHLGVDPLRRSPGAFVRPYHRIRTRDR